MIHESLLTTHLVDPTQISTVIIDLGRIEIKTQLVHREKEKDYRQETNANLLYDTITIKFGKLKISVDY